MSKQVGVFLISLVVSTGALAADVGNRLTYLDEFCDPYYAGLDTPKLVTPQWVGEEGVEAVVVLAVDDMTDPARYEQFLRPILNRLKQIDGRAPVSIMTKGVDVEDPQLQRWLREGVGFGAHTIDHPCPCLQNGSLAAARDTFGRSVDLLATMPNNRTVAYRMPCCDSMNSVSPRFFTEIFNKTTPDGHFLAIDSSVFQIFSARDPELPRELVFDADGREKFRKYVPTDRPMVNLVENYPYPYVIGRTVWEFPCLMPSDWDAQHLNGECSPTTLADLKTAVDAVVTKQGVFSLCFHPHGWIEADQVVELVDYAAKRHGPKVKFLTFREVQERLDRNLLDGSTLRASNGEDNGVRLLDVDNDGYMDVVIGNQQRQQTRRWLPNAGRWQASGFPVKIVTGGGQPVGVQFAVLKKNGSASLLDWFGIAEEGPGAWHFDGDTWVRDAIGLNGLPLRSPFLISGGGRQFSRIPGDVGLRARDLDRDGICELIVGSLTRQVVLAWNKQRLTWVKLPFSLPPGTAIVVERGRDAGLRFVDFNEDGFDDVVFSNGERYSAHLFTSVAEGWSREMLSGSRDDKDALPMIIRGDGTNNGAWFNYRHMWVQNEDTGKLLPDHVDSRYFTDDFLAAEKEPPPRSPAAALASFKPQPGFKIELMAAEPMVMDPIDIAWGPDGKAWVVEMTDYPMGIDDKGKPGGRVRFLEDTDGDGHYDKSTVFLEPIGFPSGVMPWRNGVLITAAPSVFYAEDTDGDGRADVRHTLMAGFHEGNQQHRVNHPRWGLDNWVHLANGDSDGLIKSHITGDVVDSSGRDLRFKPDEGLIDTQTGRTQFGRNRDDWGNWFGCNNNNPGWNYVLEDHYIRRNPFAAAPVGKLDLTQFRDVYPAGRVMTHCFYDQPTPPKGNPGRWTSVAGVMVYRDDLFGPEYAGNLFVEDSVYNVVHRMILDYDGIRIRGHRGPGEDQSEFLATTDPWFRPATMRTGPDGALWVTDMYRYVIEHPQWIDDRLEKTLELRRGHDKGRIWRICPVDKEPRRIPRLDRLDTAGLVAALDSPNGWQRDLAQQMLLWRADRAAVKLLEAMLAGCPRPQARLHALCTLDGLEALRGETVVRALSDSHPGVRRHAVRVSESLVDENPAVGRALLALADDPDAKVQMQLAYSLGEWDDPRAGRLLGQLAVRHQDDPHMLAAVISSAIVHVDEMIEQVNALGGPKFLSTKLANLRREIEANPDIESAMATLERSPTIQPGEGVIATETSSRVLEALDKFNAVLNMTGDSVRGKKVFVDATCSICHRLEEVGENIGPDVKTLVDRSPQNLLVATIDPNQAVKERFVEYISITTDGLTYNGMLMEQSSNSVTLANGKGEKITVLRKDIEELVPTTKSFMPEGLEETLDLQKMADLMAFLGKAGPPRKRFNGNSPTTVLASQDNSVELRAEQAEIYGPEITFDGDTGGIRSWTNAEAYVVWSMHLNRGQKFDVWACWSCPDSSDGNPYLLEVGANTITGNVPAGGSPDGGRWDKVGQLDLATGSYRLGFRSDGPIDGELVNLRTLKLTKRGEPPVKAVVEAPEATGRDAIGPETDGSFHLSASTGRGVGPKIKYMPEWKAFGWFTSDDRVQWTMRIPRPGQYEVWLEWSVDKKNSGKPWELRIGPNRLIGVAADTGSWETYRRMKVGRIELESGIQSAMFKSGGQFEGALLDLRDIHLVPTGAGR